MVAHPGTKCKEMRKEIYIPTEIRSHIAGRNMIQYYHTTETGGIMSNWKNKLMTFMYGRYGVDALYRALNVLWIGLWLIGILTGSAAVTALAWLCLIYMTFRMMSRNIARRQAENAAFLKMWNPIKGFFVMQWRRVKEFRTAVYRKCPDCGAMLRLPHRRGQHTAACPRCGRRFDVRILF